MKKEHSILEVLFPQVRAEIVRLLFAPPQKERYVRELMSMSGLRLSTVQDELRKLNALQLVVSRSNRYHRFYRAPAAIRCRDHRQPVLRVVHAKYPYGGRSDPDGCG